MSRAWFWCGSSVTALVLITLCCGPNVAPATLIDAGLGDGGHPDRVVDVAPAPDVEAEAGWSHLAASPAGCSLDVPSGATAMTAPSEWVPCAAPIPTTSGCRQMRTGWTPGGPQTPGLRHIVPLARGSQSASGRAVLMFARGSGNFIYRLIEEADGPVLSAIRENAAPEGPRCVLYPYNTAANRFAYALLESEASGTPRAARLLRGRGHAASSLDGCPPSSVDG